MEEKHPDTPSSEQLASSVLSPPTPGLIWDDSDDDESVISSHPPTPPSPFLNRYSRSNAVKSGELSSCKNAGVDMNLGSSPSIMTVDHSLTHLTKISEEPESHVPQLQSPVKRVRGRPRAKAWANTRSPGVSTSPDRFIPAREFTTPSSTAFHVGQNTEELSPEERILRHRFDREDPFMDTPQERTTSTTEMAPNQLHSTHHTPHLVNGVAVAVRNNITTSGSLRHVSAGTVWNVGGPAAAVGGRFIPASRTPGGAFARGTTARMYTAKFLPLATAHEQKKHEEIKHEARVALALDIDRSKRLLNNCNRCPLVQYNLCPALPYFERFAPLVWENNAWRRAGQDKWTTSWKEDSKAAVVPIRPFRVLDAPRLRDDFYCSTIAYSPVCGILAVGLGSCVYLWSDIFGVQHPPFSDQPPGNFVTSMSFSSENGRKSILAVGRRAGLLSLWSAFDSEVRFEISHLVGITCVAFRPTKSRRLSERFPGIEVDTEELAVGDENGNIWYYSVEWPDYAQDQPAWEGSMTLMTRISAHSQQICGISWSPDGTYLATGGNDNVCLIFELQDIIPPGELRVPSQLSAQVQESDVSSTASNESEQEPCQLSFAIPVLQSSDEPDMHPLYKDLNISRGTVICARGRTFMVPTNYQKHRLNHFAAVKAIAFAPWQPSLLATGGGTNDRAIHFYHTSSGACLATINVYAQVTGLIWSKTRREIVATLGYSIPEHPYRIAVFAWPSCEQISAVPWGPLGSSWGGPLENSSIRDCGRILCAISYPCRPPIYWYDLLRSQDDSSPRAPETASNQPRQIGRTSTQPRPDEGGLWCSRTVEEGCIVVASSNQTVKFHEVWSNSRRHIAPGSGAYGGSEILEGLEALDRTGDEVIR